MANYTVDPELLRPYLPCSTELDVFGGNHYVSLVGFLFANTKVMGLRIPYHHTFEEVNLRFYVRYKEAGVWKRGVVFLKEIVPLYAIAAVANALYGEKYVRYPMQHRYTHTEQGLHVKYAWKMRSGWNEIDVSAGVKPEPVVVGSEEEFITEHYWGYTFVDKSRSGSYQVAHPQWRIHRVHNHRIVCDAATLYGPRFAEALAQPPVSVFMAEGSAVTVYKGSKIFAS